MILLLDTNVIIDYMGRRKPFYEDSERMVAASSRDERLGL